mmetsp:Transcript_8625/g.15925  ORF Transcript_8625/g.15925 Transcript_8625/m.15925 type:complete len:237 (+) Transcript_8625:32-742(+)
MAAAGFLFSLILLPEVILASGTSRAEALEKLWEEHMKYEFVPGEKSTSKTMDTMVDEPYVNHIPTLIGGMGKDRLRHFYHNHFIFKNVPMAITPVSRTVGNTQLVDEMVIEFNHTDTVDWLVPGVPATGKNVKFPLVAIVRFRCQSDETDICKLAHEHIYWDQATILKQLGLIDLEGVLDVSGQEQAEKVLAPFDVKSNAMLLRTGRFVQEGSSSNDGLGGSGSSSGRRSSLKGEL